jgi:hypothetical protein
VLTIEGDTVRAGTGTGAFYGVIRNLEPQVQYYVRAYATTIYGTVYSDTMSFYTKADIPTVITEKAENVSKGKVDLACTVADNGRSDVHSVGIYWSTINPNPTESDNKQPFVLGIGRERYSGQLTGLKGGTTYYIRAYAINDHGLSLGQAEQFTTPPIFTTNLAAFPGELQQKSNAYFVLSDSVYIVGGDKGPNYTNELRMYSISNDKWYERRALISGAATRLTGTVYGLGAFVFGGLGEDDKEKNSLDYYNASENKWTAHPSCPEAISSAISFTIPSGNSVYFVGGQNGTTVKKTVWNYDMAGHLWTRKADFPVPQYGGIAVVVNGVVYAGMGKNSFGQCNGALYTTVNGGNTWSYKTSFSTYAGGILCGVACGNYIYVIDEYYSIYEYNTNTNIWSLKSSIPPQYRGINCIFEKDGRIYIGLFGGDDVKSFIIYDPVWDI